MCVGIPMVVRGMEGAFALCTPLEGAPLERGIAERVDMALVPEAEPGDFVLVFLGLARSVLSEAEARRIAGALGAVAALSEAPPEEEAQSVIRRAFADLLDRPPSLPPHLEAARLAGREDA